MTPISSLATATSAPPITDYVVAPMVCPCGHRDWLVLLDAVEEAPYRLVRGYMCGGCDQVIWQQDDAPRLATSVGGRVN